MQNQIQIFENEEFGQVEVLMLDDKPYFPATECATILGYATPRHAVTRHCPHVLKRAVGVQTGTKADGSPAMQNIEKQFIPESNLYRLIIRSKLPAAERFESWVFDEVLPSIREYGGYITDNVLDHLLNNPEVAQQYFTTLREEREKRDSLQQRYDSLIDDLIDCVEVLKPKAEFCDVVMQSPGAILTTVIAKDYGMSAVKFNKLLNALGIQYKLKTSSTWVLYQEHEGKGYTVSKTYDKNGKTVIQTCWTQRGRYWLYVYLKANGILPKSEHSTQLTLEDAI